MVDEGRWWWIKSLKGKINKENIVSFIDLAKNSNGNLLIIDSLPARHVVQSHQIDEQILLSQVSIAAVHGQYLDSLLTNSLT